MNAVTDLTPDTPATDAVFPQSSREAFAKAYPETPLVLSHTLRDHPLLGLDALADLAGQADCVLIDAPCSGTGTWRRKPEAKWRLTPDRLARFSATQDALLALGAKLVKPGGRLVFTCWQDLTHQQHLMVPLTAALDVVPTPEFTADTWSYPAFSLADPARTQALLAKAGFADVEVQPTVAPMYQGADLNDALRFLRQSEFGDAVFGDAGPAAAVQGWEAVATALAPYVREDGVFLDGAAWLVTATRT